MTKVLLFPIPEHPYLSMETFDYNMPVEAIIDGHIVLVAYDELVRGGAKKEYLSPNAKGYPFSIFKKV